MLKYSHKRRVILSTMRSSTCLKRVTICMLCMLSMPLLAYARTDGVVSSQLQKNATENAIIINLVQDLQIFTVAAQKYTFENTGNIPWNDNDSTTPVTYSPFLLYAGAATSSANAESVCGFTPTGNSPLPTTALTGNFTPPTTTNGGALSGWSAPSQYLPDSWKPDFSGTYCAVVTLNSPAAKQANIDAYYVAPNGTNSSTYSIHMAPASVAYNSRSKLKSEIPNSVWTPVWKPAASTTWKP